MNEVIQAKLNLYRELLKVDPDKLKMHSDNLELMSMLSKDKDIQNVLDNKRREG